MSPASDLRAGVTPEASRDRSSGTLANNMSATRIHTFEPALYHLLSI
jgi:hypothetical protein